MSCKCLVSFGVFLLLAATLELAAQAALQPSPPPSATVPPRDQRPRTGTARITGRVIDGNTGRPLRRAGVRATGPAAGPPRSTMTDAEGRYMIANLPAGDYVVNASKGGYVTMGYRQTRVLQPPRPVTVANGATVESIDIALPRGGVITGRVVDEFGEPVSNAMVMPMRWAYGPAGRRLTGGGRTDLTNDIGEFRLYGLTPGDYVISARLDEGALSDPSPDRMGYGVTFFPGTADESQAQPVRVALGDAGVDVLIPLVPSRTATVSGIAVDASGQPIGNGNVSMSRRVGGMMTGAAGGQLNPDGTFSISGVGPGEYVLRVSRAGQPMVVAPNMTASARNLPVATISVQGEDLAGVVVAPPRLATVTGRVVGEGALLARLKPGSVRVGTQATDPADPVSALTAAPTAVKEDFTFEYQTGPGRVYFRATAPGLFVKAVWLNGVDVIDRPVEIGQGDQVRDVEVEVTDRIQRISGTVADAAGKIPESYVVLLFSEDPERWGGITRYTMVARPGRNGEWAASTLPPGDYYAVALEYVEPGQWTDPDFLESIRAQATRVTLAEGQTQTLALRLTQM